MKVGLSTVSPALRHGRLRVGREGFGMAKSEIVFIAAIIFMIIVGVLFIELYERTGEIPKEVISGPNDAEIIEMRSDIFVANSELNKRIYEAGLIANFPGDMLTAFWPHGADSYFWLDKTTYEVHKTIDFNTLDINDYGYKPQEPTDFVLTERERQFLVYILNLPLTEIDEMSK